MPFSKASIITFELSKPTTLIFLLNPKVIVGTNQYMTEGICLAIEELGLSKKIKVVGFFM